jgi:dihydropyrimidinase
MKTVIKNGAVVTASETFEADVLVEDGVISAVGQGISSASAACVIDASGLLVLPGAIDVHTHMEMLAGGMCSADDFYTGTVAAAFGGTTTILDFVEPAPDQGLLDALAARMAAASAKAVVDYGFHMTINRADTATLDEMSEVVGEGLPSFKTYMAYAGLMLDDEALYQVLVRSREVGGRVSVHAENGSVIRYLIGKHVAEGRTSPIWHARSHPPEMEAEATSRAMDLAHLAGAPLYVVHVSAAESLARIRAAQSRRWPVIAETCPQYLALEESRYEAPGLDGAKYVMSPPLRTKGDQDALWQGLADGAIQTVATDHCPYNLRGQKDRGREIFAAIPNGAGGVETRLPLLYHYGVNAGRITVNRFVEMVSTAPARLFGLGDRKGSLAAGRDADIVLWDPQREVTISAANLHQNVDYTPFEGFFVRGWPALTMLRGHVLVRDGNFLGIKGMGRFLRRNTD